MHYGDAGQWIETPFTVTGTVNTLITNGWITHDNHQTQKCWDYSKQYIDMISLTTCGDTTTTSHGIYMGTAKEYADVDFTLKVKEVKSGDQICEPCIDVKYNDGVWNNGRVRFLIKSDGDDVYITMDASGTGGIDGNTRVYTFTEEEVAKYRASGVNWRVVRQGLKLAVYLDDNKCNLSSTNTSYAAYFQGGIAVLSENGNFTAENNVTLSISLFHKASAKLTVDFSYKLYTTVDEELLGTTSLNTELFYINKKKQSLLLTHMC